MISKISRTLKITWEPIQYTVMAAQKYPDRELGLHKGRLYTFAEVLKGEIKGRLTEP